MAYEYPYGQALAFLHLALYLVELLKGTVIDRDYFANPFAVSVASAICEDFPIPSSFTPHCSELSVLLRGVVQTKNAIEISFWSIAPLVYWFWSMEISEISLQQESSVCYVLCSTCPKVRESLL